MQLLHKTFPAHQVKVLDEAQGIIEAYVSVYNVVDHAGDRVLFGAFAKSLATKLPKGVWCHDWTLPVAKTLQAEEVPAGDPRLPKEIREFGGLRIVGQFNLGTQRGKDAFSDLLFGSIDEFSFGYIIVVSRYTKGGVQELVELIIYEWSPVLVGCNPATQLVSAKGAPPVNEIKAQYLGMYAEVAMTEAALQEACSRLFWHGLDDAMYNGTDRPKAERLAMADAALTEFHELAMRCLTALLPEDADPEAETKISALKTEWKRLWPAPGTEGNDVAEAPAARADEQLDTLLADAQRCAERQGDIAALRAKEGRALSEDRRRKLIDLAERLTALAADPAPKALSPEAAEALLIHYRQRMNRREPAAT